VLPFDFSTYAVAKPKGLSSLEEQTKAFKLAIDYAGLRKAINRPIFQGDAEVELKLRSIKVRCVS
jgi:hypothetical protein